PLCGQCREILLACLECSDFFTRRTLEILAEPQHRNKYSRHASGDVLSDLRALFASKLANFDVVRFNFGDDHRTCRERRRWAERLQLAADSRPALRYVRLFWGGP